MDRACSRASRARAPSSGSPGHRSGSLPKTTRLRYAATDRVHLVSSWLASLLTGATAAIDPGDGSGMNLMDLATKAWSPDALAATAPNLAAELPRIAESWTILGTLSPNWQRRHGLPAARVAAWSGDNPCSLVRTGLVREVSSRSRSGTRATRISASCPRLAQATTEPGTCSRRRQAPTWA